MAEAPHYIAGPDGASLTTLALQHEHHLVVLRRRLREIGNEFNFDNRDIARLSTAAYEAARQLFTATGQATAEVRLTRETRAALRVIIRAPTTSGDHQETVRRLEDATRRIEPLVDRLTIEQAPDRVSIVLLALPAGGPETRADAVQHLAPVQENPSDADVRDRYGQLQTALRDMQIELQETNRGVVATYAELKDQTGRVRQAEDRVRMLLDSVPDYAICLLGPDGAIVGWNQGGTRLFGLSDDDIVGRHVNCLFQPRDREAGIPEERLGVARDAGRYEGEALLVRHGGSVFDASVVVTVIGTPGNLRGFSLVVHDISDRKRLEADLHRRGEELEAAHRAKEDFLATLSHELRTPLNAMLGWTRLLRLGRLDGPATARALETIERNAHLQEQLIADILDVSRIVTGKLRLELRPVDLVPILSAAVDAVRPTADAKGVTLLPEVDFPGTVLGDADRLQQVFWNLLSNAVKFTPRGGRIVVSSGRVGAFATIRVADTGEGISPELLPYVFDRFRQGDGSATRPHGGLGLGLSIVRHLIELHGGQTQAWSEGSNRGATFVIQLPVRAVQRVGIPPAAIDGEPPLAGLKILVVDDEADAREVVSTALAQCGARTAAVASAREAMQMIADFSPDVVVSDIAMPGEDGYTLVRRIRGMQATVAAVPVVALTAFTRPEDRRRAMRAGFRHFVPKPVEIEELAAVVRTVAEQRTGRVQ